MKANQEAHLANTETLPQIVAVFPTAIAIAVSKLKTRLEYDYEQAYPSFPEIVHIVLDEEEAKAWELLSFPHSLLPDLVEARIASLGLQPAETRHNVFVPRRSTEIPTSQPALALCG